jgi:glycine cleavage system H protein
MKLVDTLKYTKDHEWVKIDRHIATIGITDFAQSELGDIIYVEVEPVGETVDQGEVMGSVEAVKTVSDIFMPISGTILEINEQLHDEPELVNTDPYGNGWIVKITCPDLNEWNDLLSVDEYKALTGHKL